MTTTTTRIHVFGYATGDGGAQLAPSGNPHTVSAETASRLISAGLARAASQSPLAMPFYVARISADEVATFTDGWPGTIYELDQPPHTWYRWDGSGLTPVGGGSGATSGGMTQSEADLRYATRLHGHNLGTAAGRNADEFAAAGHKHSPLDGLVKVLSDDSSIGVTYVLKTGSGTMPWCIVRSTALGDSVTFDYAGPHNNPGAATAAGAWAIRQALQYGTATQA